MFPPPNRHRRKCLFTILLTPQPAPRCSSIRHLPQFSLLPSPRILFALLRAHLLRRVRCHPARGPQCSRGYPRGLCKRRPLAISQDASGREQTRRRMPRILQRWRHCPLGRSALMLTRAPLPSGICLHRRLLACLRPSCPPLTMVLITSLARATHRCLPSLMPRRSGRTLRPSGAVCLVCQQRRGLQRCSQGTSATMHGAAPMRSF